MPDYRPERAGSGTIILRFQHLHDLVQFVGQLARKTLAKDVGKATVIPEC